MASLLRLAGNPQNIFFFISCVVGIQPIKKLQQVVLHKSYKYNVVVQF